MLKLCNLSFYGKLTHKATSCQNFSSIRPVTKSQRSKTFSITMGDSEADKRRDAMLQALKKQDESLQGALSFNIGCCQ